MVMFKGREEAEVQHWIDELEAEISALAPVGLDNGRGGIEQVQTLRWLKSLIEDD